MRLIDADGFNARLGRDGTPFFTVCDIENAPTVDAVPVVHGKWENGNPFCPVCKKDKFKDLDADIWSDWKPDYCPNCGAKMDGDING